MSKADALKVMRAEVARMGVLLIELRALSKLPSYGPCWRTLAGYEIITTHYRLNLMQRIIKLEQVDDHQR